MMKRRKLIALACLICCSALRVEAQAAPAIEPTLSGDVKKTLKLNIQSVVRSDGRVVDRLVETNSSKLIVAKNTSKQRTVPDSPEAWLTRMMDPTKNGLAAKHPELFAEWLDAVTEPRFMTALASVAMTPETYTNTLGKMADPATARNWVELADPQVFLRWMNAGVNPQFYQAIFNRMTDSGKLRRWGIFLGPQEKRPVDANSAEESSVREISTAGSEAWLQLPARESNTNPWLSNNANYRY